MALLKLKIRQDQKRIQMKEKIKGHGLDREKRIVITEDTAIKKLKERTAKSTTESIQTKSEITTDTEKMTALIMTSERIPKTEDVKKNHYFTLRD